MTDKEILDGLEKILRRPNQWRILEYIPDDCTFQVSASLDPGTCAEARRGTLREALWRAIGLVDEEE